MTKAGLKIRGHVRSYKSDTVEIEKRGGLAYVNRERFRDRDPVYQAILLRVIATLDYQSVDSVDNFREWLSKLGRMKRTLQVDGVLIRLESGDKYVMPLFFSRNVTTQYWKAVGGSGAPQMRRSSDVIRNIWSCVPRRKTTSVS